MFYVRDTTGNESDVSEITITIESVNDAPTATFEVTTLEDTEKLSHYKVKM